MRINVFSIALLLAATLIFSGIVASAQSNAQDAKTQVGQRLRDNKTKVTVETTSGRKVKGTITAAGDDSFIVTKDNRPTSVTYAEVTRIKGVGWSTGKKIGIFAGIGGAVTALALYLAFQAAVRRS